MKKLLNVLTLTILTCFTVGNVSAAARPSPVDIANTVSILMQCGDATAKMTGYLMYRSNGLTYEEVLELIPEDERRLEEDNLYRAYSIDFSTIQTEDDARLTVLMDYDDCIEEAM